MPDPVTPRVPSLPERLDAIVDHTDLMQYFRRENGALYHLNPLAIEIHQLAVTTRDLLFLLQAEVEAANARAHAQAAEIEELRQEVADLRARVAQP